MKYAHIYILFLVFVFNNACKGQNKAALPTDTTKSETKEVVTSHGPNRITRNIIQDRKGNIWIAAFDGIFRYDGKSFTNITSKVSSARFFSVLEDRKGNMWFGSIGSGVYYYDGKSFRNFTTKEGLAGNGVTCIYEDKAGNIWFGTGEGASCYDGKSFRNFKMKEAPPLLRLILSIFQFTNIGFQKFIGCIMMLILSLKTKQASFGLAQEAIPSYMMERYLPL